MAMQSPEVHRCRWTPRWWAGGGVLLVILAMPLGQRAEAAPADDLPTLIRQLSHGKLTTRDAAVDRLLALGPPALPAIERAIPAATGEAAFRLPLIAEAIAVTATNRLLELQPADATASTTALGPFSMAVERVDQLGTSGHRLLLRLRWQPPLKPVLLRLPLASVVAEGSAGAAVPLPSRRGAVEPLLAGEQDWVDLPIRLGPSPPGIDVLASLRGTVVCWLPGFAHRFMLPLDQFDGRSPTSPSGPPRPSRSLAGVSVWCDDWSITAGGPAPAAATGRVALSARFAEPSEAFASHRGWLANCRPELLLPAGDVVTAVSHRVVSRNRHGLSIAANFGLSGKQLPRGTLVSWRLPLGVRQVPVDFWLRSVPLGSSANGEN